MRIYGLLGIDANGDNVITTITTNPNYLDGNIYYTDKDVACIYNTYDYDEVDWFPWNCTIYEYTFYYQGKFYSEEKHPKKAVDGFKVSEYKEGKLIKTYFSDSDE